MIKISVAYLVRLLILIFHLIKLKVYFNLFVYHSEISFYHLNRSFAYLKYNRKYYMEVREDHG